MKEQTAPAPRARPPSRRGLSRARGRAVLAWSVLGFAAFQLTLSAGLEWWWPTLRDPEYGLKLRRLRALLRERPSRGPLVVVLGSSRTGLGLRPAALEGAWEGAPPAPLVYNFSLNGSGALMELMCLRRLLDDGVRPQYALIEVWPFHLHVKAGPEGPGEIERWRGADARLYAAYWSTREPYRVWRRNLLLPARSHRTRLLSLCAPWLLPRDQRVNDRWVGQDGWGSQENPEVATHDPVRFARLVAGWSTLFRPALRALAVQPAEDRALREMLTLCRREGIRAALLFMPECRQMRRLYSPASRATVDRYLARLGREFEVPVIDAQSWSPDEDFADTHHLSVAGGERFTRRLGEQALKPWLAGRLGPVGGGAGGGPAGRGRGGPQAGSAATASRPASVIQ